MLRTKMFSGARSAIGVGLAFVALSFAHLPAAQAETPSQFVASLGNSAIHTMVDEGLTDEERIRKFHVLLVDRFDLPLIGRYVLGVHWRRASAEQRIEFSGLFEDYLVSIYASRLGQYGGESLSVKSTRSEGQDTIVTTGRRHLQGCGHHHRGRKYGDYAARPVHIGYSPRRGRCRRSARGAPRAIPSGLRPNAKRYHSR